MRAPNRHVSLWTGAGLMSPGKYQGGSGRYGPTATYCSHHPLRQGRPILRSAKPTGHRVSHGLSANDHGFRRSGQSAICNGQFAICNPPTKPGRSSGTGPTATGITAAGLTTGR